MKHPQRRDAGVTLIESVTVVAIVAVLVGVAVPGFQDSLARRQLEGVAAQLEVDLQLARSEAVARNESVRVGFTRDAGGSCYVLHTGPAGGCRCDGGGTTVCSGVAEALRSVPLKSTHPVQLKSSSASVLFDAVKGTVTPTATVRVQSPVGELRQVINVMGRVRTCSPDAAVPGYRRC